MIGGNNMANETEKLTINLGVVELAQIDVLVEQGIYSNRSDFIRTSIRKQLEVHSETIENQLTPLSNKKDWTKTAVGIISISQKSLERLAKHKEKLSISVIGMLTIDKDISTKLFEETVSNVMIRGKLIAPYEIKKIIKTMN